VFIAIEDGEAPINAVNAFAVHGPLRTCRHTTDVGSLQLAHNIITISGSALQNCRTG
jgi:hypothetical protein